MRERSVPAHQECPPCCKKRVLRGSEGPVPGRVGSRGEADAPSDREGRPSRAQAYWRYAEPGAGSPTKGWRCVPSPQAPVAHGAAFSAATSDPRAASGVLVPRLCGVLTVRLRARSCACPPRLGSPLSRDETLPGTGPLQRRSNAKVFARRCTRQQEAHAEERGEHREIPRRGRPHSPAPPP